MISGFALISPWLPNNYMAECFLWLYMCRSRQTEEESVGEPGQQNPSVVISGPDNKQLPLHI